MSRQCVLQEFPAGTSLLFAGVQNRPNSSIPLSSFQRMAALRNSSVKHRRTNTLLGRNMLSELFIGFGQGVTDAGDRIAQVTSSDIDIKHILTERFECGLTISLDGGLDELEEFFESLATCSVSEVTCFVRLTTCWRSSAFSASSCAIRHR